MTLVVSLSVSVHVQPGIHLVKYVMSENVNIKKVIVN